MPDAAGTPPLPTDFSARLAAAREEGRQQGRREVLDVVREQEEIEEGQYQRMKRGWLPHDEWGPQSHAYASQLLETIARECDALPAEEE